ncbi:MAG TPA: hypothetical protein VNA25_01015 [Phycisphaerae bacterium]|nr:hypothetical protein [Phycisphaerae bacterium]
MMTPRKILGLAVAERAIDAVEIGVVHGRCKVLHAAEFPMPEGDSAQDPALLGKALRQFLRQHHFSASRCVIGLGTKWLIAKEKALPPTSADLIAGVLAIATEREFASDRKNLVFDYSGPVKAGQGQSVLLVAAPRRNVDHLLATADAAGLTVLAVTSSMMSLASATAGQPPGRRLMLHLSPDGAELSMQSGGGFRLLRRLSTSAPAKTDAGTSPADGSISDLADELRRVIALLPGAQPEPTLEWLIWNTWGLSAGSLRTLGERLPLAVRVCRYPSDLGIAEGPAAPAGEFAAAAALALAGLQKPRLAVDFLHSRLVSRKRIALKGKVAWAAGVAAAALIAGFFLLLDWQREHQEIEDLKGQLEIMQASVATAKDVVDKTGFARGWYDRRPRFLDCLRELTLAFPVEGRIWATSLAMGENMRVLLSGKATGEGAVLEVLDRLKGSPGFSDVKPLYIREVGGETRDVSFAISFRFVKAEGP